MIDYACNWRTPCAAAVHRTRNRQKSSDPTCRATCRAPRFNGLMHALAPQKITFAEMRASGVRGLLIYCSDFRCSHWTAISGDRWLDDVRLSDLEPRFTCQACGTQGADIRPDFGWERKRPRERRSG